MHHSTKRTLSSQQYTFPHTQFPHSQTFIQNNNNNNTQAKGNGILFLLDEESKLPKATDSGFTDKLHNAHKNHFRLQLPRKSKMSYYKSLRDNEGFIVRHFAGAVCYQTDGFIDKNNDALTADLFYLMDSSKDPFLREMFEPQEGESKPQRGKISLISLGTKFKAALILLMEKLNSTRSNFIRCIKPNQKMQPKIFTGGEILSQLQCAGMVSVLDLMQGGFPSRTMFKDLYDMYKGVLPRSSRRSSRARSAWPSSRPSASTRTTSSLASRASSSARASSPSLTRS